MIETLQKNQVLLKLAETVLHNSSRIIHANQKDLKAFPDMDESMKDRLIVDEKKVEGMAKSLTEVAEMKDPVGKILYDFTREDGLHIENRTVPFGKILIIYESRPDVTIEAAATAFKAGNRILLKGGKEAYHTNSFLTELWHEVLSSIGIDPDYVTYLNLSHRETQKLISENTHKVDLIIPRGGDNLIKFVQEHATVPVIISGRGNNFLYVDYDSDFDMAIRIIINGKSRISVCNALDKVLINKNLPDLEKKINQLLKELTASGIEVIGSTEIVALNNQIKETNDENVLYEEFLAPKLYIALAPGLNDAIETINTYSGKHSSTIITNNKEHAEQFMLDVDSAAVYFNASTRFTDGGQFGVGAEIAISTQKLHFLGPLGAQELVTNKWFVYGQGHIRE